MSVKVKKRIIQMVAATFLAFAAAFAAYAADPAVILQQWVTSDSVMLYLRGTGENPSAEVRISTESAGNAAFSANNRETKTITWLLIDNSISVSQADREKTKQLLTNLVAGRSPNESFCLCTFDEKLNVLLKDSQSYAGLKAKIDALQYIDQETYLTDVLSEVLDNENKRSSNEFVRMIIISDGVDNNPGGITREELNQRLKECNYPIYTFGCQTQKNTQMLKEMYALSRQTNGRSWSLSEMTDTMKVVQEMSGAEMPVCATVAIPEALRDGTQRGIQLSFNNGTVTETQVSMPFGSVTPAPEPTPEPTPEPLPEPLPEPEPEKMPGFVIPLIIGIVVLLAIVVVIVLMMRRNQKRNRIEAVSPIDSSSNETEALCPDDDDSSDTVPLVNNDKQLNLILTDQNDPDRHFDVPLRGAVKIGRGARNHIVIDYDKTISTSHCEIFVNGKGFAIRDLGSKNGTYVSERRVADIADISSGSIIKLGQVRFKVQIR